MSVPTKPRRSSPCKKKSLATLAPCRVEADAWEYKGGQIVLDPEYLASFFAHNLHKSTIIPPLGTQPRSVTQPVAAWNLWRSEIRASQHIPVPVHISGLSLQNIDMQGIDLEGVTLEDSFFSQIDFEDASLARTTLRRNRFEVVSFLNASFQQSLVEKSVFALANFRAVLLSGAALSHCRFRAANFEQFKVRLLRSSGVEVHFPIGSLLALSFQNCKFDTVTFYKVHLLRTLLERCEFSELRIRSSLLKDTQVLAPDFGRFHQTDEKAQTSLPSAIEKTKLISTAFREVRGKHNVDFRNVTLMNVEGVQAERKTHRFSTSNSAGVVQPPKVVF